jgi:putative tryptophan/tyrosine transport system substrate-binding protein
MQFDRLKRRQFITLLGGAAAAWPLAAHAQQPAMPVIGHLRSGSPDTFSNRWRSALRQGLKEIGYVEGENLAAEYRWAEHQLDRLPALAAELVRRKVTVITVAIHASAIAAKAATTTIPIVFIVGEDPVRLGLVTSLARPGGNLTGINFFANELAGKRLEVLCELVPAARRIAVLVNPTNSSLTEATVRDVEPTARALGLQIQVLNADTSRQIDAAFATFVRERPDAHLVGADPYFINRRLQLAHLATRHAVPVIYGARDYPEAGGLISYGASLADAWHHVGVYSGRILKGTKPADLPVVQSTKFEMVINAQTARTLGLDIPATLLARADEVIE